MAEPCQILVVDDEPGVITLLSAWLQEDFAPCEILAAGTLEEGIALAQAHHPMAIILDLGLPGTGGIQTIHAFHKAVPTYNIVVISGLGDPDVESQVLALHLNYQPKPFHRVALADAIRTQARQQHVDERHLASLKAVSTHLTEGERADHDAS